MKDLPRVLRRWLQNAAMRIAPFRGSTDYWRDRYARGGDSGAGSYGSLAAFKAEAINAFVAAEGLQTVIEFGCGDGNQLSLARYPRYRGYDVSDAAIGRCRATFASDPSKSFELMSRYDGEQAELALSLDVVYHLVEQATFESYLRTLFGAATRNVIVYSTDYDRNPWYGHGHVRHRNFTRWVAKRLPQWELIRTLPGLPGSAGGGLTTDLHFYRRR